MMYREISGQWRGTTIKTRGIRDAAEGNHIESDRHTTQTFGLIKISNSRNVRFLPSAVQKYYWMPWCCYRCLQTLLSVVLSGRSCMIYLRGPCFRKDFRNCLSAAQVVLERKRSLSSTYSSFCPVLCTQPPRVICSSRNELLRKDSPSLHCLLALFSRFASASTGKSQEYRQTRHLTQSPWCIPVMCDSCCAKW